MRWLAQLFERASEAVLRWAVFRKIQADERRKKIRELSKPTRGERAAVKRRAKARKRS